MINVGETVQSKKSGNRGTILAAPYYDTRLHADVYRVQMLTGRLAGYAVLLRVTDAEKVD